jgi:hypothetical protein
MERERVGAHVRPSNIELNVNIAVSRFFCLSCGQHLFSLSRTHTHAHTHMHTHTTHTQAHSPWPPFLFYNVCTSFFSPSNFTRIISNLSLLRLLEIHEILLFLILPYTLPFQPSVVQDMLHHVEARGCELECCSSGRLVCIVPIG